MNNKELRELVKKHFNLVEVETETKEEVVEEQLSEEVKEEATVETNSNSEEVVSENSFGEINTADGELTLVYDGEEIAIGIPIFVKTDDGNIPAPDGEHALEGGVIIETEGGSITEIKEAELEEEEEIAAEETDKVEAEDKEEMSEEVNETEEVIKAISELVNGEFASLKKEMEELKTKFENINGKVDKFSLQPAAERTKAEITKRNLSKVSNEFKPINDVKQKQFDRLVNLRKKQ